MLRKSLNRIIIILIILILILSGLLFLTFKENVSDNKNLIINNTTIINPPVQTPEPVDFSKELREKYDPIFEEKKAINDDFIAWLEWENDLLYDYTEKSKDKYPHIIVRSQMLDKGHGDLNTANNEYLRHTVAKEYNTMGQEFMDASNVINSEGSCDDQNIIIYGHYIYVDKKLKFSPLHELKKEEVYQENDNFSLTFANEKREYQITDVFSFPKSEFNGIREESPFATNYSPEELKNYMYKVKHEYPHYVSSGITINENDKFVTLQTCTPGNKEVLLIVLAKEINRIEF